jgi:maleate cis-trans isomerase
VTREDLLDAALESDLAALAASPELRDLIDTGAEVGGALGGWRLDGDIRARIYAAAIANAVAPGVGARLRALGVDRRAQAIAGGAVVTLAAAAAVGLAVGRGRRRAPVSASALRA